MARDSDFDGRVVAHSPDPWSVYAELRERAPVLYSEKRRAWYLFRHDDALAMLTDPRFGRDTHSVVEEMLRSKGPDPAPIRMTTEVTPDVVRRAFSSSRIGGWCPIRHPPRDGARHVRYERRDQRNHQQVEQVGNAFRTGLRRLVVVRVHP